MNKDDFVDLLAKRNENYNNATEQLLNNIKTSVLDGIGEFFVQKSPVLRDQKFVWNDIELVGTMFMLFGTIKFEKGTMVRDEEGNDITINEQNIDLYSRPLKIALPQEAVMFSKEQIVEHLHNVEEHEMEMEWELLGQEDNHDNDSLSGFNLDELTDDQLQQLHVHNIKGKSN